MRYRNQEVMVMARGVLVTGGAHGIGKQICLDFLSLGDFVCFIDIDQEK